MRNVEIELKRGSLEARERTDAQKKTKYWVEPDLVVGNLHVSPELSENSEDPETHKSPEGSQSPKTTTASPASSQTSYFSATSDRSVHFSESSRDSDPTVSDVSNQKQEAGTRRKSSTGSKGASVGASYKTQQQKSSKKKRKSQQKNRW